MQPIMNETAPRPHPVGNLFTPIKADDDITVERITQAMQGLPESYLNLMLVLAYALENGRGDSTPAEELIHDLVFCYGHFGGCLTLEDVEDEVEEFRDNWKDTVTSSEVMARQYPHLFSAVASDEAVPAADAGADGGEAKAAENTVAKEDELEPRSTTARMAADTFERCIETLASLRRRMLFHQDEGTRYLLDDLAGASLLKEILGDWESGCFADEYPKEHGLLSAIRGDIRL